MIKKFIPKALIAAVVSLTMMSQASAELKIATVNLKEVLGSYYKMEELQAELKKDEARIKSENDSKLKDIKALTEQIKALRTKLSDTSLPQPKLKAMEADYKRKFNQLNQADRQRKEILQGQIRALNLEKQNRQKRMFDDIQEVINEYAATKGYDLMIEKGKNIGVILYAKASFDVSADITKLLNEKKATPAPAPADE